MTGYKINRQTTEFGEHVRGWRMVLGLTAQQVAERADITRDTLRRIETGVPTVSFGNVALVLRALGVLDQTVEEIDPLNSDVGRLRVGGSDEEARPMTTVEVLVDAAGRTRLVGQAHFTRTRQQISTTFLYDTGYLADGGMAIDPALPLVSGTPAPARARSRIRRQHPGSMGPQPHRESRVDPRPRRGQSTQKTR